MANMTKGSTTSLEAAVGEASLATPKVGITVSGMLEERRGRITQALGKFADADHFMETVVIQTQKEPKLLNCTHASLMGAVMQAAQLRLEFGQLGLVYLVPRRIKGVLQAQFMVGYRGYIDLSRRSGDVKDIVALPVYEKDIFRRWRDENGEHLLHEPHLGEDRGEIVRFYGHCILKSGGQILQVMELSDIAKRRAFSESAHSDFSPWNTNPEAMALKSCVLKMKPWLPLTISDAQGLANDETVIEERGERLIARFVEPQRPELESQAPLQADVHGEIQPESEGVIQPTEVQPPMETIRTVPPQGDPDAKHLSAALGELDDTLRAEAEAYLKETFGSDLSAYPAKGVLETLDEWLNSPADPEAQSTQQRASEHQGSQAEAEPPWDPETRSGGTTAAPPSVPDDLLADTKKKIDTWPAEICDRILGEWGQAKTGNLAAKRTKLLVLLAPERVANNPAAVNLF